MRRDGAVLILFLQPSQDVDDSLLLLEQLVAFLHGFVEYDLDLEILLPKMVVLASL
jgi:hypothetical protein